jgi:thymidylate kinase
MLCVIEGPDGAGKSFIVDALTREIERRHPGEPVEVLRRGAPSPKSHALDEYVVPLVSYRPSAGRHVICDRWHWGEVVYPRVLDRSTTMSAGVFEYVEAFLETRGALVIYVNPGPDAVARNLTRRVEAGKPLGETPPYDQVTREFHDAYLRSSTSTFLVTYEFDAAVAKPLVDLAEVVERVGTHLSRYVTYVGAPRPNYLLVGDARNGGAAESDRPGFMPYPATSGDYLLKSLTLLPPPLGARGRYGIINANDVDDVVHLYKRVLVPHVVALGNRAHAKLRELGISHGVVPHPQFWRRFLARFPGEYATLIFRALETGKDLRGEHPTGSWLVEKEST